MPSVAIHVISHSVHRSHDRWYFVSRGFRDAVLLYYGPCQYSPTAEYVSASYIPHVVRANYKITIVADPPLGRRSPSSSLVIFYSETLGIFFVLLLFNPFPTHRIAASGMSVARSGWNEG